MRRLLGILPALATACAGGILYGLAFPPYDLTIFAWVALVPLLLFIRERPSIRAALFGVLYGFACSVGVAGWLMPTMARFFDLPLILGVPFAWLYSVAFWGTSFGLFAAGATRRVASGPPVMSTLFTAALWVATELWRSRVLGQGWCLLGYSQHTDVQLIQLAALTGVYGVSFLVALGNAAIAEAIVLLRAGTKLGPALRPVLLAASLVAVTWLGGAAVAPPEAASGTESIAIVQTNVPPAKRWSRAYTDRQIASHTRMTDDSVPPTGVSLVVWPENAVPRYLEVEPGLAGLLGGLARRHASDLLFGTPRHEAGSTYNSVRLITAAGRNGGAYDKQELVLLAEATPLRSAQAGGPDDNPRQFTAGTGPGVLRSFVPLGVSICHELLFPRLVARSVAAGAELLVNVSNDGWLDAGTGVASRQHFAMGAFRAVETRRWLVRAATTGVSGVFDPYGHVVASLPPHTEGVLLARVGALTRLTPYVRLGDVFAFGGVGVVVVALAARWRRRVLPR